MIDKDNGGPAFPTSNGGSPDDGMTLRDYFAAKALPKLMAMSNPDGHEDAEATASWSYAYADSMLKERNK